MADLSNEYYVLFPPSNYSLERIKPLNTKQDVERCETDIQLLTELNPVVKMLLAAQRKIKGTQKKKRTFSKSIVKTLRHRLRFNQIWQFRQKNQLISF